MNHMKMQKSLIFAKKILKINMLKIKNIVKLQLVINGNIEMPRIAYVILNIVYLQKFLWFFIMDKTMIISLS